MKTQKNKGRNSTRWLGGIYLLLCSICSVPIAFGQVDCEKTINYSLPAAALNGSSGVRTFNDNRSVQGSLMPFAGIVGSNRQGHSLNSGFMGFFSGEPNAPLVNASEGQFLEHVQVDWVIEDEFNAGAIVDKILPTRIFRNGVEIAQVPHTTSTYLDFNVFPGEFYSYQIVVTNNVGESRKTNSAVGFLNPNGRITGRIESRLGSPAEGVKVTLSPNLGRTILLDGIDDYLYFSRRKPLKLNGEYTVEGWFRNNAVKEQTLFMALDSASRNPMIRVFLQADGTLATSLADPSQPTQITTLQSRATYNTTTVPAERKWHHFAVVRSATACYLYVDGRRVAEQLGAKAPGNLNVLVEIGKDGPQKYTNYYQGYLDEFRVWNAARSRPDIRKYIDLTLTGQEAGLYAYWKFDEQSGVKMYDRATKAVNIESNYFHGFLCGALFSDVNSPVQVGAYSDQGGDYIVTGVFYGGGTTFSVNVSKTTPIGFALRMHRDSSQYVSFHKDRMPVSNAFTLEGWFKVGSTGAQTIFESTDPTSGQTLIKVGLNANGQLEASTGFSGAVANNATGTAYNDDFWHHFAISHNGTNASVYVDGQDAFSLADGAINAQLMRYVIGRSQPDTTLAGSNYFDGLVDEMRLWRSARSKEQINGTRNQILPLSPSGELAAKDTANVEAYWQINDSRGLVIRDISTHGHTGDLQNAISPDLFNWSGDDIPLDVEYFNHSFQPNRRNTTLDRTNISVDNVNFTDESLLTTTGFIRFANTDCFAESVELLVNNASVQPIPVFTNTSGVFSVELEPGTVGTFLSPTNTDWSFDPNFIELPTITRPLAGLSFGVNTTRKLVGTVGGGSQQYALGGDASVVIESLNGCYTDTFKLAPGDSAYQFTAVPPLQYKLFVRHSVPAINTYFQDRGATTVDLRTLRVDSVTNQTIATDTLNFTYYSDLGVEMAFTNLEQTCDPTRKVVRSNLGKNYNVVVSVFETYNNKKYPADQGTVSFQNQAQPSTVADTTITFTRQDAGKVYYQFKGGVPNISPPYTKPITVIAKHTVSNKQSTAFDQLTVLGYKTLGATFSTTSPELPYFVLRDPPGDQSYTYMSRSTEVCRNYRMTKSSTESSTLEANIFLGPDVEIATGIGVETTVSVDITSNLKISGEFNNSTGKTTGSQVCMNIQEIFSTSADEYFVGPDADIFVGGAMNVVYGTNRFLELDANCGIVMRDSLMIYPQDFATTYVYTRGHIRDKLIPDLRVANNMTSALSWEAILRSSDIKAQAAQQPSNIVSNNYTGGKTTIPVIEKVPGVSHLTSISTVNPNPASLPPSLFSFQQNYSLAAGAIVEKSITSTRVSETIYEWSSEDIFNFAVERGLTVNGVGATVGMSISSANTTQGEFGQSTTDTQTTGFVLADGDLGDFHTIDVGQDGDGNLVFDLKAGNTSCPWEPGTRKRESLDLIPTSPVTAINVPSDEPAAFTLQVSSISESGEDVASVLKVRQETNVNGATVKINGVPVSNTLTYLARFGAQQEVVITLEKGQSPAYVFDSLEIELISLCMNDYFTGIAGRAPDSLAVSKSAFLSATFVDVCTKVQLDGVATGWLVNGQSNNQLPLSLINYDINKVGLDSILFQYRPLVDGQPFVNAKRFTKDSLQTGFTAFTWNIPAEIPDGGYEIRAISFCSGDIQPYGSPPIVGRIDRMHPTILGVAEPADGVLQLGDEIRISFNEQLNCGSILSLPIDVSLTQGSRNNVALVNSTRNNQIDKTVSCFENQLVIVPNIQNKFLEEQVLRVDLLGLEDNFGNIQTTPISWEFRVNRNPLTWVGGDVQQVIQEGNELIVTRQLRNSGAFALNYAISGTLSLPQLNTTPLPSWITATPHDGNIPAGATQTITFRISNQLPAGHYRDQVVVATTEGGHPLNFDVRSLCPAPNWTVNPADYPYSMTVTSLVDVFGTLSTDSYDKVGAFINGQLRGVGSITYEEKLVGIAHPYQLYLTLYGDTSDVGQPINFEVWDASTCELFARTSLDTLKFVQDGANGTPTLPDTLIVDTQLIGRFNLARGWNWLSFNLVGVNDSISPMLAGFTPINGDLIKSQNSFSVYDSIIGGWSGNLLRIDPRYMYQMRMGANEQVVYYGQPSDFENTQIPIHQGWNYVGYMPVIGAGVDLALSSLTPTSGDEIRNQSEFAQYVENIGWTGSLKFMNPGDGYLLRSSKVDSLKYPLTILQGGRLKSPERAKTPLPLAWKSYDVHSFEYYMGITADIIGIDPAEGDWIGAFVNGELRGYGEALYIDGLSTTRFFINAASNTKATDETMSFVYYQALSERFYQIKEAMPFIDAQIKGSPKAPIHLRLGQEIGLTPDAFQILSSHPNPFKQAVTLSFALPETSAVTIQVWNAVGQLVQSESLGDLDMGKHEYSWNGLGWGSEVLPSGMYMVRIQANDESKTIRLIKSK